MKLLLITDAWEPQVNGVVRTLQELVPRLGARNIDVVMIEPTMSYSLPAPFFAPDMRLALPPYGMSKIFEAVQPEAVHISTEGPLGFAARSHCIKYGIPFTTWYHSHFALYANARVGAFGTGISAYARHFHAAAQMTFVSNESLRRELAAAGYGHLAIVPLGVDTDFFLYHEHSAPSAFEKPVFLYFGRIAAEKSPEEFFALDLPGTKLVIGDGPMRPTLEKKYGSTHCFVGPKTGKELADLLSQADVLVFPSRTETFGLAVLEALACGIPVVAHDVMGPRDLITNGVDGYLTDDFQSSALHALSLSRDACRAKAMRFTWDASADAFAEAIKHSKIPTAN